MKKIYMYVLDTMADWENGYLLQGLSLQNMLPNKKYQLHTFSINKEPIKTAGGLTIIPDMSLDEIDENEISALLLIGADTWLDEKQKPILDLAYKLIEKNIVVGAICGSTLGLANKGILDKRVHTSNALFFLTSMANNYNGQDYYKNNVAVCDNNLITASSAGSLLWAKYILEKLELYSDKTIEAWYQYFNTGNADYFNDLINSFKE